MARFMADIRPEERGAATTAFFGLFGILASHTILETARDALFLSALPASQLPWMYLAIAGIAMLISDSPLKRFGGVAVKFSLSFLLLFSAVVTFGFSLAPSWIGNGKLYAFYVWTGVFGTLATVEFWMIMGERYTVTQAKRMFRLVGTGSVLGAVAGATIARVVAGSFPAEALLPTSASLMALTAIGPAVFLRRTSAEGPPGRGISALKEPLRLIQGNVYLKNLTVLVLVSTVAITLADYVFKSEVARAIPKENLASFFATFYMGLNIAGLLTQFLLAGVLMRLLGLHQALWVLPSLIALGSAGVAFGGRLVAALFMKGADGAFRFSLNKTAMELLFVPIPDSLRSRVKPFIDGVTQRAGQAIASVAILSDAGLQRGDYVLASAAAGLSIVWIAFAADLKKHYLNLFRDALREGSMHSSVDMPELDLGSLESLFSSLNSTEDGEVLAALDLLAEEGRVRLVPALLLFHPSSAIVLRTLELFEASGRDDFIPIADRLLGHPDPEVRAGALRARNAAVPDEKSLRAATADVDPLVRATALVGLVSRGMGTAEDTEAVEGIACAANARTRLALARAITRQPSDAFVAALTLLGDSGEEEVQLDIARAMGAVRSDAFLPALISYLVSHEVRPAAREALVAHGDRALAFLSESLADEALPHEIRRHVPRSLILFEPVAATKVLQARLLDETDGLVRFKIIRALGRIATDNAGIRFDDKILDQAIERTVAATYRLIEWRLILERGGAENPKRKTTGHDLLVALLRDKETHAIERMFRLLSLRFTRENFKPIHRGLGSSNAKIRATSRELTANVLRPPLRDWVAGLIDDAPDAERLAARGLALTRALSYEELLGELLEQPGETIRSLAAGHIGELGLVSFADRLRSFDRRKTGLFVRQVFERALRALDDAARGAAASAG